MDETISLSELTPEHKKHLKLWIPDLAKFVLVYPKKIFWFITKNIPIVDKEKKPIVFLNKNEAYKMLHQLKSQA
jgi:hypothetical protein